LVGRDEKEDEGNKKENQEEAKKVTTLSEYYE